MKIHLSKELPALSQIENYLENNPDGPISYEDDIAAIHVELPESRTEEFLNLLLEIMHEDLY